MISIILRGDEYVAHTKCVTEAERYGGKDYVPKSGANKGERKQQEWLCIVNNLLNTGDLSNPERNFLNTLSKFENIPRKKPKFLNFVSNALNNRIDMLVVENAWNKMQNAYKSQTETPTQQHNNGMSSVILYIFQQTVKKLINYTLCLKVTISFYSIVNS